MTILTSCFCNNTFITYTYSNNILMKRKIGKKMEDISLFITKMTKQNIILKMTFNIKSNITL